jgi:hypothetical protein
MPVDNALIPTVATLFQDFIGIMEIGFVILFIFYFLFSLVVIRQVNLMTETVITEGAPLLRFLAILHAGIVLAVIVMYIAFV